MPIVESEQLMTVKQMAFLIGFTLLSMAVPLVALGKYYLGVSDMITWGIIFLMVSHVMDRCERHSNRKA
jgi:hypothetical protein